MKEQSSKNSSSAFLQIYLAEKSRHSIIGVARGVKEAMAPPKISSISCHFVLLRGSVPNKTLLLA